MFDVEKVRNDFPILKRKIHGHDLVFLDSGATSQKPESVLSAMNDYYHNTNANIHRGVYELSSESTRLVDEARGKIAAFIGAKKEEIIFTRNASESINLVMYSWGKENIGSGDAVLVSRLEHHSNLVPWQELCREKGAELRIIDVDANGNLKMTGDEKKTVTENGLTVRLGSFESLLDDKIKMFAITGASNVLGTRPDIQNMIKRVKRATGEAKVLVDASQMVPHMKVNVNVLGADFLVFSGHKMLGPTGVGVLWGKNEILSKMKPFLFGGDMIGEVKLTGATWADIPSRFEAGTPDIAGIVGLGAAIDYLNKLGMENVQIYEKSLMDYALQKMSVLENEGVIKMYGPKDAEDRGGALPFNITGVHAHDAAQILDSFGIAVRSGQHCAAPLVTGFGVPAMVRVTFYIYNTIGEIDYLVEKIRNVPKVFA